MVTRTELEGAAREPDRLLGQHHDVAAHVHERLDVARILQEGLLRSAVVVAGADTLDALVSWCLPWDEVVAHDSALDGVVVVAWAEQLSAARLRGLAGRGAVAVFVDVSGQDVPAEVAAGSALPLIGLPRGVTFAALNRLVAELALAKETHVLQYGVTVHRTLAELLFRGSGLPALACQLSRLSGCPVLVLDPIGRRLAEAYEGRLAAPSADDLTRALQAEALRLVDHSTLSEGKVVRTVEVDVGGHRFTCLVSPIVLGGRHDGWVALVELDPSPGWHELARHRVVVEQATTIMGAEILRQRSVDEAAERARGDFVHALLHGRLSNPGELAARAEHYDVDVSGSYAVVVARGFGVGGSPEALSTMLTLARNAAQLLPRKGAPALVTVVGDVLVVIRQTDGGGRHEAKDGTAQVAEFATALSRDLSRRVQRPITVAYGRPVRGAQRIVDSYREARITLGVCERLGITEVSGYGELRVFAALLDLAESPRGRAFAQEVLKPLRRADVKGGGGLEEAVLAYIASGGNLNAAARKLSMHRNTMLYKLERAARALGMDLREAEHQFTVWLAHRVEMLSDVQATVSSEITPRS